MKIHSWMQTPVQEIMTADVLTLSADDTLQDAVDLFMRKQISGAPVINEAGKCVGVLTTHDVTEAEEQVIEEQTTLANAFYRHSDLVLPVSVYEQDLAAACEKISPALTQAVGNFMVDDVVHVGRFDPIERAVRFMVDAQIHRVIVTNAHGTLCGLLSMTDVMAALLRASQEERHESDEP